VGRCQTSEASQQNIQQALSSSTDRKRKLRFWNIFHFHLNECTSKHEQVVLISSETNIFFSEA